MPTVRTGLNSKRYHLESSVVALDASGNGTSAITFDVAYANVPVGLAVPPLGVNGAFSCASLTATGFTLTVTGATDLASANCEVGWVVHEKL